MLPGFPDAAPVAGLLGGVLIGLAAALMLLGALFATAWMLDLAWR